MKLEAPMISLTRSVSTLLACLAALGNTDVTSLPSTASLSYTSSTLWRTECVGTCGMWFDASTPPWYTDHFHAPMIPHDAAGVGVGVGAGTPTILRRNELEWADNIKYQNAQPPQYITPLRTSNRPQPLPKSPYAARRESLIICITRPYLLPTHEPA